MYKEIVAMADGLYYGGELVSNCLLKITKLYSLPNSDEPTFADVEVRIVGREPRTLLCSLGELSFDYVKTQVPLARCSSPKALPLTMWLVTPSVNTLLFMLPAVSASKKAFAWCVPVANSWPAPVPRIRVPWPLSWARTKPRFLNFAKP